MTAYWHQTSIGASYFISHGTVLETSWMDHACWYDAYFKGYRPAHYPVPALIQSVPWFVPCNRCASPSICVRSSAWCETED